jgi:hypothetical protein
MAKSRPGLWKWIGAALVASVGYSSYSAWRADAAYQEKLARLRELGVATRVEDLPLDETDPRLQAAIDELNKIPDADRYSRQLRRWVAEGPDRAVRAREALASVIPAAMFAADSDGIGYKLPDYVTPDPRLQEMSSLLRILTGEAELATLDGDFLRSLESLKALHKLSVAAARGSGYMPYLIGHTGISQHHYSAQTFLDRFGTNEQALRLLKMHLESTPDGLDFRDSFKSQFAVAQEWLSRVSSSANMQMNLRENGIQYSYMDRAKGFAKDSSFIKTQARHELAEKWIRVAEIMKDRPTDHTLYGDLRKLDSTLGQGNSLVAELVDECNFIPASSRVAMQLEQIAMKRVLLGATEILLARLKTGKLPNALPPGETFSDPLTGKPLIYKLKGNGFVLYSFGADMTDDGGRKAGAGGRDIVFEYRPKG